MFIIFKIISWNFRFFFLQVHFARNFLETENGLIFFFIFVLILCLQILLSKLAVLFKHILNLVIFLFRKCWRFNLLLSTYNTCEILIKIQRHWLPFRFQGDHGKITDGYLMRFAAIISWNWKQRWEWHWSGTPRRDAALDIRLK